PGKCVLRVVDHCDCISDLTSLLDERRWRPEMHRVATGCNRDERGCLYFEEGFRSGHGAWRPWPPAGGAVDLRATSR
ncbi:MAG TPA: hypothetical protein VF669_12330, partial [Tepidisphaeraceae bacterium]